jgi:hypothetical protein
MMIAGEGGVKLTDGKLDVVIGGSQVFHWAV